MEFSTLNGYGVKDAKARDMVKKNALANHRWFYVDDAKGNDNNDGLTQATAFKTMDKFFSLANSGETDLRCYIVSAGMYDVSHSLFSHLTINIVAIEGGTILDFVGPNANDQIFDHCNVYFKNITLREESKTFRFASGTTYFENVAFECENLVFRGCHIETAETFTIPKMTMYGCTGVIMDVEITGQNAGITLSEGCSIAKRGRTVFPVSTSGNAIYCADSTLFFLDSSVTGSGYTNGLNASGSVVILPQSQYEMLVGLATTPLKTSNYTPCIIAKATEIIGGDYE